MMKTAVRVNRTAHHTPDATEVSGIMWHVGIDVGTNTTAPKILMERLGMTLNEAAFATSLYFIFRTLGCLTGSFFLRVLKMRTFFAISIAMMALSMCGLFVGTEQWMLYTAIALVGYGNSNVFSMCFATALESMPEKQNEVHHLPAADGLHERRYGTGRSRVGNSCWRHLPLYVYQTIKNRIKNDEKTLCSRTGRHLPGTDYLIPLTIKSKKLRFLIQAK